MISIQKANLKLYDYFMTQKRGEGVGRAFESTSKLPSWVQMIMYCTIRSGQVRSGKVAMGRSVGPDVSLQRT